MSSDQKKPPTADDQDAAALLMLFQSQSSVPQLPSGAQAEETKPSAETISDQHQAQQQQKSSASPPPPSEEPTTQRSEAAQETQDNTLGKQPDTIKQEPEAQQHENSINARPDLSAKSSGGVSGHSRSNSGNNNNFSTSPGPAAAALAGDNHQNKHRDPKNPSNMKAMVAAAALAAAAATPFPLVSHLPEEQKTEDAAVGDTLSSVNVAVKQAHKENPTSAITQDVMKDEQVEESQAEEIQKHDQRKKKTAKENAADAAAATQEESSYFTDPDSGTIGCICEYDHDDGFTIQCDRCYRWQHASCMGIKSIDEVPDFYLCYLCDKSRQVNKAKAREAQRDFLMPTSKRKRLNSIDNEALREEIVQQVRSVPMEEITPTDTAEEALNQQDKDHASAEATAQPQQSTEGQPQQQQTSNSSNNNNNSNNSPVTTSTTNNNNNVKRKEKPAGPQGKEFSDAVDDSEVFVATKDGYKTVYFPLDKSEFRNEITETYFSKLTEMIASKKKPSSALISDYNAADVKKKLAKNRISVKPFAESSKMRFQGFSRFSVIVENNVNESDMVLEAIGEIQLKQDYIDNPFNHYNIWGVAKPKVFFIPDIPFIIDARYSGNEARFIRRSCSPTCEIKAVALRNDETIRFFVSPLRALKAGQELTIPWDWDPAHPINKIIKGRTFDQLDESEKPVLVRSIETVLNGCECACTNSNECYLNKVKKSLTYLYRSTRKINIPTFGNNMTKYADIYRQKDESYHQSINDRLEERDRQIMIELAKAKQTTARAAEHSFDNGTDTVMTSSDPESPEHHKREFVIKKHHTNNAASLDPEFLPYRYKIAQSPATSSPLSGSAHMAEQQLQRPRTFSQTDQLQETSAEQTSDSVKDYPIPVSIAKPAAVNRVPSVSGSISARASLTSATGGGSISMGSGVSKPPIKKKMSLKDYMKSKKK